MICDRCHTRIARSENPDQPLCRTCCRHLRAGGAWDRGAPTPEAARERHPLDLELLPLRANILYGAVPRWPVDAEFQIAASVVTHEEDEPAAHWQIEAVRWRRQHGGVPLDDGLPVIAGRTAARLWRLAERRLEEEAAQSPRHPLRRPR